MAEIIINETELTSPEIYSGDSNLVFIPLKTDAAGDGSVTIYTSLASFTKKYTVETEHQYARHVLEAGLPIAVSEFKTLDEFYTFLKPSGENIQDCILTDRFKFNVRILTLGEFKNKDTGDTTHTYADVAEQLISIAANRGDCYVLLDCDSDSTTVADVQGDITSEKMSSEYAAAFAPFLKFVDWDANSTFPGTLGYLVAFGKSLSTRAPYEAVAGMKYGIIPGASSPTIQFGEFNVNELQPKSITEISINPICSIVSPANPSGGCVVWGTKTTYSDSTASEDKKNTITYKSYLNIRNLLCTIKKHIFYACVDLTFEQNTDILWVNFKSLVNPVLDNITSGGGIRGYRWYKETSSENTLKCKLLLAPIFPTEDFKIDIVLTPSVDSTAGVTATLSEV